MIYKNIRNRNLTPSFAGKIEKVEFTSSDISRYIGFAVHIKLDNGLKATYYHDIPDVNVITELFVKDFCDTMTLNDTRVRNIQEVNKLVKGTSVILFYDKGGYNKGGNLKEISAGDNRYFSYERFLNNRQKISGQDLSDNEDFCK